MSDHFPKEMLPKEIYVVFDINGLPHAFFDIEKCPVHYIPGKGIDVAVYRVKNVKHLDTEFHLVEKT